jgi:hypothetical protein
MINGYQLTTPLETRGAGLRLGIMGLTAESWKTRWKNVENVENVET